MAWLAWYLGEKGKHICPGYLGMVWFAWKEQQPLIEHLSLFPLVIYGAEVYLTVQWWSNNLNHLVQSI